MKINNYDSSDYDIYDTISVVLVVVCTFISYIILDYVFV